MDRSRSVVPENLKTNYSDWHFSPGHWAENVLFLSGCTGSTADGGMSTDFFEQCRAEFKKIDLTLAEANLGFGDIVELTTYHVGLQGNPAWIIHEATRFFRAPFSCSKSCSVGNTVCIPPGHVGSFTEFATEKGVGERIRRFSNSPG